MLADSGLEELVRAYARVVGETRALDAEKKALVYDNYSKLISATETIRKVSPHPRKRNNVLRFVNLSYRCALPWTP